jgi:hypothetical protein
VLLLGATATLAKSLMHFVAEWWREEKNHGEYYVIYSCLAMYISTRSCIAGGLLHSVLGPACYGQQPLQVLWVSVSLPMPYLCPARGVLLVRTEREPSGQLICVRGHARVIATADAFPPPASAVL